MVWSWVGAVQFWLKIASSLLLKWSNWIGWLVAGFHVEFRQKKFIQSCMYGWSMMSVTKFLKLFHYYYYINYIPPSLKNQNQEFHFCFIQIKTLYPKQTYLYLWEIIYIILIQSKIYIYRIERKYHFLINASIRG